MVAQLITNNDAILSSFGIYKVINESNIVYIQPLGHGRAVKSWEEKYELVNNGGVCSAVPGLAQVC